MPAGGKALVLVRWAAAAAADDDGDATLSLNTSIDFTLRFLAGVSMA